MVEHSVLLGKFKESLASLTLRSTGAWHISLIQQHSGDNIFSVPKLLTRAMPPASVVAQGSVMSPFGFPSDTIPACGKDLSEVWHCISFLCR